jgi:hypothetical protein
VHLLLLLLLQQLSLLELLHFHVPFALPLRGELLLLVSKLFLFQGHRMEGQHLSPNQFYTRARR